MQEAMLKRAKKADLEEPLSKVELKAIQEYREAVKKGKLISHEQLKREIFTGRLTKDDYKAIRAAEKAKKEGKTITHEQLKKELGARCT